jgi:hypothetical protein
MRLTSFRQFISRCFTLAVHTVSASAVSASRGFDVDSGRSAYEVQEVMDTARTTNARRATTEKGAG